MLAVLIAELLFDADAAKERCPVCGNRSIRIAQVWEMYAASFVRCPLSLKGRCARRGVVVAPRDQEVVGGPSPCPFEQLLRSPPRVWEPRDREPPWCRSCGARFRYRDGKLIPEPM